MFLLGTMRPLFAETNRGWKKRWDISVAALAAANFLDAYSSRREYETNPLLRNSHGYFSVRKGLLIKSAASGGFLLMQQILINKMPEQELYRPAAIINLTAAGVLGGIAIKNSTIPQPKPPERLLRD